MVRAFSINSSRGATVVLGICCEVYVLYVMPLSYDGGIQSEFQGKKSDDWNSNDSCALGLRVWGLFFVLGFRMIAFWIGFLTCDPPLPMSIGLLHRSYVSLLPFRSCPRIWIFAVSASDGISYTFCLWSFDHYTFMILTKFSQSLSTSCMHASVVFDAIFLLQYYQFYFLYIKVRSN